jgi:ribonuclease HII
MSQPVPNLRFERAYWTRELNHVAGLDEVGRGAWAGPVLAGAVILPCQCKDWRLLRHVRDSKLLSPRQRQALCAPIRSVALAHAIGMATREEIDRLGIVPATRLAMQRAVAALSIPPDALLVDALELSDLTLPQMAIIRGDQRSLSIACASILAKVARDEMMVELDAELPGYAFARHKGYGTAAHRAALEKLGACREHRTSFAPVRNRRTYWTKT